MGIPTRLGVALVCLAGWAPGGGQEPVPIDGPSLDLRAEYFAMRPLGATSEADPVGLVAWKRSQRKTGDLLECEILFGDGDLRVLLTEGESLEGTRLVWRELGSAARTWVAEWSPGSGMLKTTEFSSAKEIHQRERVEELSLPLALVEECRKDRIEPESLIWLNPSGAGAIEVRLVRHMGPPYDLPGWAFEGEVPEDLRWVELLSSNGVTLTSYLFQGETLMGIQWGTGSPWALPVGEGQWRASQQAWHARQARLDQRK